MKPISVVSLTPSFQRRNPSVAYNFQPITVVLRV